MSDRRRRPKPWVQVDYPNREHLTRSEAMGELRRGPALEWFRSWISTGDLTVTSEVLRSWVRYELVHVYYDAVLGRPVQKAVMYDDSERFRWALSDLYAKHISGKARCSRAGNEHLGTFYFVYPGRPYTEVQRDEEYQSPIGAMLFHPGGRGLL
jgi:hypothetical protein